ncbi:MAG: ABC transporter ATP-binding protein [Candidatus Bathyarchaeia archaeon]
METVLEINDLHVSYFTQRGEVKAVNGVSLNVGKMERFGLVGESGCGKSTLAHSILRLIKPPGKIIKGSICVDGVDILRLSKEDLRSFRWKKVSIIFQGAMNSLNPTHRIGSQLVEAILAHERMRKEEALNKAVDLLKLCGIDPLRINSYPFQLSGGMKQRVVIAMAIALNPSLIIADEPTTALDVVTERKILALLKDLQKKFKFSIFMISHNIDMLVNFCDRIAVMYAGKIVEVAPTKCIISHPLHPYLRGLLRSRDALSRGEFWFISGSPPDLINLPSGCAFHPRCQMIAEKCRRESPTLKEVEHNHFVSCHMVG